jgi:hypothetical protein
MDYFIWTVFYVMRMLEKFDGNKACMGISYFCAYAGIIPLMLGCTQLSSAA